MKQDGQGKYPPESQKIQGCSIKPGTSEAKGPFGGVKSLGV